MLVNANCRRGDEIGFQAKWDEQLKEGAGAARNALNIRGMSQNCRLTFDSIASQGATGRAARQCLLEVYWLAFG